MSIAAASGGADGGLMALFLILLPFWALPLACRAQKTPAFTTLKDIHHNNMGETPM